MHDPIDTLLAPSPLPEHRLLKQQLLHHTTQALRGQRRWRQLTALATLAGTYAAGLLTVVILSPQEELPPPRAIIRTITLPPRSPVDLEWQALEQPVTAAALYRDAGDGYLAEADPAEALRCYRNALEEAKPGDLDVAPGDSWLMVAIKQARQKEREACEQ